MSKKPDWQRPATGLWRATVILPDLDTGAAASDAFGDLTAVSAFEESPDGAWRVEGFSTDEPDRAALEARLALTFAPLGITPPVPIWEKLPPTDWLRENQQSFQPLEVGRYFIHGSHFEDTVPPGRIGLLIDAATAFGTGEHATTRGCLLALDAIVQSGRPARILDMGTGTGVLAMAAAKSWRRRVIARDIDPESVRVTRHNARANGVAPLLEVYKSNGYRERGVAAHGAYDLIFANILAGPLERMAADLGHHLAPGGIAVLSGLLARQANGVLAAHRQQHVRLLQKIIIDGWATLVIARARPAHFRSIRKRATS